MTEHDSRPPPPQPAPMHHVLAERAAAHPERMVCVFDDRTLTCAELEREARCVAAGLQARGVRAGDAVLIALGNRSELLITLFALAHLGALAAPINYELSGTTLAHTLDVLDARHAVAMAEFLPRLRAARRGWGRLEQGFVIGTPASDGTIATEQFAALAAANPAGLLAAAATPGTPWLVIFTSGTTGLSKGVVLPHQQVASAAWDVMHDAALDETSVFYTFLPMFHLNAIVFGPLAAILSGCRAVVRSAFPREHLLQDLCASGATHWTAVAYVLRRMLQAPPQAADREHRLRWTLALGVMPEEVDEFERRFGCPLYAAYGATESGMLCSAQPSRLGTAGHISPRHEVRIVDDTGNDVSRGTVGEIWSRPRRPFDRMLGYYRMPDATAAAFAGDWFRSGDRAWLDDDDGLHFYDRIKEMIKRRGESISTQEVEGVLLRYAGIANAAVVGYQVAPDQDEEVRAFLEADPTLPAPLDLPAIVEHCSRNLAPFMVPRLLDVLGSLPRNAVGKVEKQVLRQQPLAATTYDTRTAGRPPTGRGSAPA